MMQQYKQIKQQYPDTILFFRLGDFYEMFFEDAVTASQVLQITLTSRSREGGKDGKKVPMCGVPHHAANGYIAKMIQNGYKIAICEQLEDPALAKGIVKRDVIRVITPGTFLNEEDSDNHFLAVLAGDEKTGFGLASVDIGTGEFAAVSFEGETACQRLLDELQRINPAELLLFCGAHLPEGDQRLIEMAEDYSVADPEQLQIQLMEDFDFLRQEQKVKQNEFILKACCGALAYLEKTQKMILSNINHIRVYSDNNYMNLDAATRTNLELTEALRGKTVQGSLFWLLNFTKTAMGRRTLKKWIEQPLIDCQLILDREDGVARITDDLFLREDIGKMLQSIYDLERIVGKVAYGSANPRDLIGLKNSLSVLPHLKKTLLKSETALLGKYGSLLDELQDIKKLLEESIIEDPPVSVHDGGIIRAEYNEQISKLRAAKKNGRQWLAELENRERNKTGIKTLRVGYNKVFGYYLEVTKSYLDQVPDYFLRKQTLVNAERFITPELKEIEEVVTGAEDKLIRMEYEVFCSVRRQINDNIARIQSTAALIGETDAIYSLACAAIAYNYVRPLVDNGSVIEIKNGRHPVVEKMMTAGEYIANDCRLDQDENRILLITGANMTGKSTYMRQVALIVLMAQIGSFVPASSALIGIVDRIFTRVGASDDLAGGQSTFMVEMTECCNILRNATAKSLIIMDEIGRGTSTYDGISIARAVTEYIYEKIGAKTLFSTHYHELTDLEKYQGISNYTIAVKEDGENIIFLRKVVAGKADRSYGVHVARLAGLPDEVIERAKAYLEIYSQKSAELADIHKSSITSPKDNSSGCSENNVIFENKEQIADSLFPGIVLPEPKKKKKLPADAEQIINELTNTNINRLTPLAALNLLFDWQDILKKSADNKK